MPSPTSDSDTHTGSHKRAREPDSDSTTATATATPPWFAAAAAGAGDFPPGFNPPAWFLAGENGPPQPKRGRPTAADEVVFRVVVPSRLAGAIIGKGGSRISQIRAESGSNIKIADADQNDERVITISSRDVEGALSNAESALYTIAGFILTETGDANTIRLLISGSQAGCLIGVSGQNIKHMRNESGADIKILALNEMYPASSHDRLVQLSGSIHVILRGLQIVASKLRENPPKRETSLKLSYNEATSNQSSQIPPSSEEHVTWEMMILENLVGGLVGRKGYNISRIRNESGATIKVSGMRGEGEQRLISVGGSAQQVLAARLMVENCISTISEQQNM